MLTSPSPVVSRFLSSAAGQPKHARLREAFVAAISAGELPVGTKVMGERELSAALGLSLGTTQKGLSRLASEGFLVRRQGHGTFVGSLRQPITGTWHARFVAPGDTHELPVFATIAERRLVSETGPWSIALGTDAKGYVMITRDMDVGGRFICASRIYLPAGRFARLLRMAQKRLADVNLKQVLSEDFRAPTLRSQGRATVTSIAPQDAALMGIAPGEPGLQVDITAYSVGNEPISFQRLIVPRTDCAMKLDFNPPSTPHDASHR